MGESTLVGWTGRGLVTDMAASAKRILKIEGKTSRTRVVGSSLVVEGGRPTEVAGLLAFLPGVSWIAVGHSSGSIDGIMNDVSRLSKTYLKRGASFSVRAETYDTETKPSDLIGRANSAVLDAVGGARVKEDGPSVRFRVTFDGRRGTAGVETGDGPGGTPTGERGVFCLVSGGMHSSVLAWLALLSGLRVELVHVACGDGALREVARLYAELSHRIDPVALSLRVLEGPATADAIERWAGRTDGKVFAGNHAECIGSSSLALPAMVHSPLYLLPESEFEAVLASLSLGGCEPEATGAKSRGEPLKEKWFGLKRADMHGVLDGLR